VLATGNKSELALGYCTLYGDMSGGLCVLADVPKTMVYALANYINRRREMIPLSTIRKPPSAELRPNQTDQDTFAALTKSLMPSSPAMWMRAARLTRSSRPGMIRRRSSG